MIELTIFPSFFNCRSASPFSMKAELLFRMGNVAYKTIAGSNPAKAPNGKFPFILDDGQVIADTHFIYQHIGNKYGVDLDAGLTSQQRAIATAFTKLAEDHLYWIMVYSRWMDADFNEAVGEFFNHLPFGIRQLVLKSVKNTVKKAVYHHGIGRHEKQKIYQFGCDDIDAIAAQLGDGSYFLGDRLASVDAIIYGILAAIAYPPMDTKIKARILNHENLSTYMKRIENEFDYAPPTHG
ncbi:MAG: glutathione S-transferase family protein [Rhizobiales bacterium]|nr:glutathione S-transferase family protein [Hyphomicrobiales bacterium]NRB14969.1 glutathione S-transferase family protein [Hyphomicrobiales bacterium]